MDSSKNLCMILKSPSKFFVYGRSSKNFYLSHKTKPQAPSDLFQKCYSNIIEWINHASKQPTILITGRTVHASPKRPPTSPKSEPRPKLRLKKRQSEKLPNMLEGQRAMFSRKVLVYDFPGKVKEDVNEQYAQTERAVPLSTHAGEYKTTGSPNTRNRRLLLRTASAANKIDLLKQRPRTSSTLAQEKRRKLIIDALECKDGPKNQRNNEKQDMEDKEVSMIRNMLRRCVTRGMERNIEGELRKGRLSCPNLAVMGSKHGLVDKAI